MALASLTVDLTLALAKFESESGRAAQIVARDSQNMANATAKADAAVKRYVQSYKQVGLEAKVVQAAVAGASSEAIRMLAGLAAGGNAISKVGSQGAAAFGAFGSAASAVAQDSDKVASRFLLIYEKIKQAKDQAERLRAEAVADEGAGRIDADGLKARLAAIKAVEQAERERILSVAVAERQAIAAAQAERVASSKALATAQVGSGAATADVQTRVFLAFAAAQAAAAEAQAQAEARVAQAQAASTAASERGQAAQRAAYETKVAYIAKVNDEAAALFRTRDAQRQLDAERAGVSSGDAVKLAKFAGDREFLASVRQQIAAEQKLADEFGKTKAQIAAQTAEQRGLTNTADSAIQRLDALEQANRRAAKAASDRKAADSFLAGLNERAAGINPDGTQKAQSQLLAEKAAILGVGKEAEAALAKIALLDGKTGQLGKTAFASRNQLLTLQYTISDIIASAGTGISPLTILLQQGPQLAQVEGGIGGIFRTAVSLATPFRLAMGGAATAIAGVGLAWFKGAEQSKAFNDAVVLSGNFAGQTEGKFNSLTRSIEDGGQVTAAAAREIGQALIATGEVGPAVFDKATRAGGLYALATGKTAKDVAESFASMSRDAARWAGEQNRSLNFVSAAQLDLIRSLQESGRSAEAQALVYDLLNTRLQALEPNLGTLDRAIRFVTTSWGKFWDAAYDVGRADTLDDRLRKAQKALAQAQAEAAAPPPIRIYGGPAPTAAAAQGRLAAAQEAVKFAEAAKSLSEQTAASDAATAKLNKQAIDGRSNVETLLKGAKAASEYRKELDKLNRDIEANAKAGTPFTADEERIARAELKKRFTDKGAVTQANDERKAILAKDLQVFTEALARERDALRFNQDQLRAIYDAGTTSLAKFYDSREAIIRAGVDAELAAQNKASARLQQELDRGKFKSPAERTDVERQLAESRAKSANIQRDADNAAKLAAFERAAAVKALTREVENFQASLLDLQGDPLGAAQLRASQQLESARILAARAAPAAGGRPPVDLDAYARALGVANDFAEVQRRVGVASANASRAEEAYLLRATQTGVGLKEQDQAVYQLRAAALVQLGELAEAAKRLADASTDPKVKTYAADLALEYAKAAQAVDPAMARLKANSEDLGSSLANVFADAIDNARTLTEVVSNVGRTVQASLTRTLITAPLEQALKSGISSIVQGANPVGNFLRGAVGAGLGAGPEVAAKAAATAATAAQTLATQTSTAGLAQLTVAASSAAAALAALSGGSVAGSVGNGLAGLVGAGFNAAGGINSLGFGTGAGYGNLDLGQFFHAGGVVGVHSDLRPVSRAAFTGAKRYHAGGTVTGAGGPGLAANEVPAILMGGPRGQREEVLHANDPRHRDNMGQALLQFILSGAARRASAAGYSRPAVRYHSGGLAGLSPDGVASMLSGAGGAGRDNAGSRAGRRGGDTFYITVPPGTSRDTAEQIASRVAQKIASAGRRNN